MSAYVIAQFDVNDVDMYYEYASKIFETTKGYGGRILAANDAEVREGSIPHLRTIVGECPSVEKARAGYEPEGYQAIVGLWHNSTTGHLLVVAGLRMPARDNKAGGSSMSTLIDANRTYIIQ